MDLVALGNEVASQAGANEPAAAGNQDPLPTMHPCRLRLGTHSRFLVSENELNSPLSRAVSSILPLRHGVKGKGRAALPRHHQFAPLPLSAPSPRYSNQVMRQRSFASVR